MSSEGHRFAHDTLLPVALGLTILSMVAALAGPAAAYQRLSEISDRLPYQVTTAVAAVGPAGEALPIDLNGDGSHEVIASRMDPRGAPYYMTPFYVRAEGPGALAQINNDHPAALTAVFDVDDDGDPEVIWWRVTADSELVLEILKMRIDEDDDAATREHVGHLSWDVTAFSCGPVLWVGSVQAAGVVDLDGDGKSESMVFALCASSSGRPRGIGVGNWETGETQWILDYGPAPCHEELIDLDGTPGPEIVAGFGAPCNLVTGGGLTDTSAYIGAFSLQV